MDLLLADLVQGFTVQRTGDVLITFNPSARSGALLKSIGFLAFLFLAWKLAYAYQILSQKDGAILSPSVKIAQWFGCCGFPRETVCISNWVSDPGAALRALALSQKALYKGNVLIELINSLEWEFRYC